MLNITKKIYPTSGQKRDLLNKLAPSINADHSAAIVFQAFELLLEAIAFYVILSYGASYLGAKYSSFLHIPIIIISALAAYNLQVQYANSVKMHVHLEHSPAFAAKMQRSIKSYAIGRWVVLVLAASLAAAGGFILLNKVTYKADLSTVAALDKNYNEAKKRIDTDYKAAIKNAETYDAQIAQSRSVWASYAQSRPNEKTYANNKMKVETAALLQTKSNIIAAAAETKKDEVVAEKNSYEQNKSALLSASKDDISKQKGQEYLALLGSTLLSIILLSLVWVFHARATRNELVCGIEYIIQMPSNEEQSMINSAIFFAKFFVNGLAQSIIVGAYWLTAKVFRVRLNFSGFGDTVEHKAALKTNRVQAEAAQEIMAQMPARSIEIEVAESSAQYIETETERVAPPRPARRPAPAYTEPIKATESSFVFTENNIPLAANSANANSANANSITENSDDANSANSNLSALERWRAECVPTQSNSRAEEKQSGDGLPVAVQLDIAKSRAENYKINKSSEKIKIGERDYTVRDLESMARTYTNRANDESASDVSRQANAEKAQKFTTIINLHNSKLSN